MYFGCTFMQSLYLLLRKSEFPNQHINMLPLENGSNNAGVKQQVSLENLE